MRKLKNAPVLTAGLLVLVWVAAIFIPASALAQAKDAEAYSNRGLAYILGFKNLMKGCADLKHACVLGECEGYESAKKEGYCK